MVDAFLWLRADVTLKYFLPLPVLPEATCQSKDSLRSTVGLARSLIAARPHPDSEADVVRFEELAVSCLNANLDLPIEFFEAVFQNSASGDKADLLSLALGLFFGGLQGQFVESQHVDRRWMNTRAEVLLFKLKTFLKELVNLLQFVERRVELESSVDVRLGQVHRRFAFLDAVFEGWMNSEKREAIIPFSTVAERLWGDDVPANNMSVEGICEQIGKLLTTDPFHVDEIPFEKEPLYAGKTKRTTIAPPTRRVVLVHKLQRIEVLRNAEFANAHIRICHDAPGASFVVLPTRTETVMIDSLENCVAVVLGAVRGVVVVRRCRGVRVTVACRQLHVCDSEDVVAFVVSPTRPLVYRCANIEFAPFNTAYKDNAWQISQNGQDLLENRTLKPPINLGDSTWRFMEPTKFFCCMMPVEVDDDDIQKMLESLPADYRKAWGRSLQSARRLLELTPTRAVNAISRVDLLYLKSKVAVRRPSSSSSVDDGDDDESSESFPAPNVSSSSM